jgi:outer membrane lipoprotein-sorting protein
MKQIIYVVLFLCFAVSTYAQTPEEIIRKSEDMYKGKTSKGIFTMIVTTPEYSRTVKMQTWNDGNDKALIVSLEPKKEAGNKLLKIGKELWSYLKNTETTMKLPSSMMLQSWNGSDLTYDDMVRESDMVDDYNIKILQEENIGGELCWKFELKPKPDAPVVWGTIYYWIRKSDNLPALIQFYDENGVKHRTLKFEDIKKMSGRVIPTKWIIINNKKTGHSTEFIYNEVEFDINIPSRIFSYRELEK